MIESTLADVVELINFGKVDLNKLNLHELIAKINESVEYEYAIKNCIRAVNADKYHFSLKFNVIKSLKLVYYKNDVLIVELVSDYRSAALCIVNVLIDKDICTIINHIGYPSNMASSND